MYVARDANGSLWLYDTKPEKDVYGWMIPNSTGVGCEIDSDIEGFEDVKWEDDSPKELIIKRDDKKL